MDSKKQVKAANPCPGCGGSEHEVRAVWNVVATKEMEISPPGVTGRADPTLIGKVICRSRPDCPLATREIYADLRKTGVI